MKPDLAGAQISYKCLLALHCFTLYLLFCIDSASTKVLAGHLPDVSILMAQNV